MSKRFALCVIDVKQSFIASVLSCLMCVVLTVTASAQPFRPEVGPPPPAPTPTPTTPTPLPTPAPPVAGATNDPVYFGLTADTVQRGRGAEVLAVDPQSPADRAGLRTGDVIERCNGQPTPTVELLGKAIGRLRVNQEIPLEVRRGGILIELKLTPTSRPTAPAIPAAPINAAPLLGVIALPVDPFAAARAGLPIRNGAVVDDIVPNSPAAMARLPLGSIIVGLDDVAIDSPDQLRKVVAERRPGDLVHLHYYEGLRLREVKLRLAARNVPEALLRPPLPADRGARLDELRALRLERQRIEQRIRQLEAELN